MKSKGTSFVSQSRVYDAHFDPVYTTNARVQANSSRSHGIQANKRCFYFAKSLNDQVDPKVGIVLQAPKVEATSFYEPIPKRHHGPRDVAVQTMYREMGTQTDPFSPDYEIIDEEGTGKPPELFVLGLHELTYANGQLPAGLDDIEAISKYQEKQQLLSKLPPVYGPKQLQARQELLEQQELKDWKYREDLIKKEHKERLKLIKNRLDQREHEIQLEKEKRIGQVFADRQREIEREGEKLQQERIKKSRKLALARDCLLDKIYSSSRPKKRNIVQEHVNFGSKLYAPKRSQGTIPVSGPVCEVKETANREDFNIEVTDEISNAEEVFQPAKYQTREGQHILSQLNHLEQLIMDTDERNDSKASNKNTVKSTVDSYKKPYVPLERPSTPKVSDLPNQEEEHSTSFLQALIRGRNEQLQIQQGVAENFLLIEELHKTTLARSNTSSKSTDTSVKMSSTPKQQLLSNMLHHLISESVHSHNDSIVTEFNGETPRASLQNIIIS